MANNFHLQFLLQLCFHHYLANGAMQLWFEFQMREYTVAIQQFLLVCRCSCVFTSNKYCRWSLFLQLFSNSAIYLQIKLTKWWIAAAVAFAFVSDRTRIRAPSKMCAKSAFIWIVAQNFIRKKHLRCNWFCLQQTNKCKDHRIRLGKGASR